MSVPSKTTRCFVTLLIRGSPMKLKFKERRWPMSLVWNDVTHYYVAWSRPQVQGLIHHSPPFWFAWKLSATQQSRNEAAFPASTSQSVDKEATCYHSPPAFESLHFVLLFQTNSAINISVQMGWVAESKSKSVHHSKRYCQLSSKN